MAEKEKSSKLSPKARLILDIVVTGIQVVIIVFCIALSIIIWTGNQGDPMNRKVNWFAIRTDSMTYNETPGFYDSLKEKYNCDFKEKKTSFNPGDMVITKKVAFEDIKVGDVISYLFSLPQNGNLVEQVVTHRVVEIDTARREFTTQGDKDTDGTQKHVVSYDAVYGKMTGRLRGIGGAVLWLQGFQKVTLDDGSIAYDRDSEKTSMAFLVIIIPLALLFIYNGFYVVKWAMDERTKKIKEAAKKEAAEEAAKSVVNQKELERKVMRNIMLSQGLTEEQIQAYFAQEDAKEQEAQAKAEEQTAKEQSAPQESEQVNGEEEPKEEPKE